MQGILDELTEHHSSYYIDHSEKPAPMFMSSGFTDDLFPVDETIRYYNRTETEYPGADLALFFGDFGHPRAQNKSDVGSAKDARIVNWFNYYVKGKGAKPRQGVETYTETCPGSEPSGGPYVADSWATIAPGEIRFSDDSTKAIAADSTTNGVFNPVTSSACATTPSDDLPGAATYKLDPAPDGGYTMMGAVSVIADFTLPGDNSQVAARLVDVAPDNTETLVDRGLWRPETGGPTQQVFQLHPNGWTFEAGHVPKLELIAADGMPVNSAPFLTSYGRPSDDQQAVTVSDLEIRIPVVEKPGSLDGLVGAPAPKFLPDGYDLAADFDALPNPNARLVNSRLKVKGGRINAEVSCPKAFVACHNGKLVVKKGKSGYKVTGGKFGELDGGKSAKLKLKLSKKARKYLSKHKTLAGTAYVSIDEVADPSRKSAKLVGKKPKKHKK